MTSMFSFRSLQESDLELLCIWLNKSHVKEWWNDNLTDEEIKTKYRNRIGHTIIFSLIVYLDTQPIGLIQYYYVNQVDDEGRWPDELDSTVGIDQFIGEAEYINGGYGTRMISEFVKILFENPNIEKIILEVDINNGRAFRCYEKAGFKVRKRITTSKGKVYLMNMYKPIL